MDWVKVDRWLVPADGPHALEVLWFNDVAPQTARPAGIAMPEQWHKISVAGRVPKACVALDLRGNLLITRGYDLTLPDMLLWFGCRQYPPYDDYQLQCISASGGQREAGTVVVALDEQQCFFFKWSRTGRGVYPNGPAYGLRLWAQKIGVVDDQGDVSQVPGASTHGCCPGSQE